MYNIYIYIYIYIYIDYKGVLEGVAYWWSKCILDCKDGAISFNYRIADIYYKFNILQNGQISINIYYLNICERSS